MAQYETRLHIVVEDPEVWSRFEEADDGGLGLAGLASEEETSFVRVDWSLCEEDLKELVTCLAETIGRDGFILADTTDANSDDPDYIVYWAGYGIHDASFEDSAYCMATDIEDLESCLGFEDYFSFTGDELGVLADLGIDL